jgi:signal peptidase I
MKPRHLILLIGIPLLIVVTWVALRLTYTLQFFVQPTNVNEPNLQKGNVVFTSILVEPERMDFITYLYDHTKFGKEYHIFRVVGIEGDTVQLRGNTLYVNGRNMDEGMNLKKDYLLPVAVADRLPWPTPANKDESLLQTRMRYFRNDSSLVTLETEGQKEFVAQATMVPGFQPMTAMALEYNIHDWGHPEWTTHDFGPVVVPADHWFVLADNRDHAMDSRFVGFVSRKDFRGTKIW